MHTNRFMKFILAALLMAALLVSLIGCVTENSDPTTLPTGTQDTEPSTTEEPTNTTDPDAPKIGWVEENGKRYYYSLDGVMLTGWLGEGENWYYLKEDGSMAVGKTEVEGETLYFGPDGLQFLLVNPWNSIPEGYAPEVVDINGWQYSSVECIDALNEMLDACREAGLEPYIASAFRTHSDQIVLHNNKIQRLINEGYSEEEAKQLAGTVVAVPGTSEHELGLAFDLVDNSYRNLDEAQETTAVQQWLMQNSWKYGFILRYPNEKSEITGIIYEPWHYRYVGTVMAKEIYDSGLCLEEYVETLG